MANGLERCTCADDCTLMKCVTCWTSDCKWPGVCKGKCRECGGPAMAGPIEGSFDCFCSVQCRDANDAAFLAAGGRIVALADMTPEQANELLNRSGLGLAGVGPREPS